MLTLLAVAATLMGGADLPPRFNLVCRGQRVVISHAGRSASPYAERYVVDLARKRFVRTSTRRLGRVMSSGSTDVVFIDEKTERPDVGAYEMYENLAHKLFSQRRSLDATVTITADCSVQTPVVGPRR